MDEPNLSSDETMIVGIGASAGGLDALKQFFSEVAGDNGLSYVVVVHLTPEHPSMLAELLQPFVKMPVQQVAGDVQIEPDCVYVIPPATNLSTIDSHLRLSRIEEKRLERAPIDHFFETLAESHRERCVGVILSGTGADGAHGISMIKERGGLTIAQEPAEAGFDGMPQNAIATGLIDLVLPVADMPRHIRRFLRTRPKLEIVDDLSELNGDRQVLQRIFAQVRARGGQDFSRYKHSSVLRRIRRRMQLHQCEQLDKYLELLRADPGEAHALANELLITVTQFFRDAKVFEHLERAVIPLLFRGKPAAEQLRVWSVGCATGEEAYSVAMLLLEHASTLQEAPEIEIFASDLHDDSLAKARAGVYPDTIEASVSPERLRRFFVKEDGSYRVRKEVREIVVFASHNLLKDPPFSRLDLIVCRNVLIYLRRETQGKVIELFHYALKPGGLLWLGPSETIDRHALFQPESKGNCLYRRRNVPPPEPGLPVFPEMPRARLGKITDSAHGESVPSYGALHQKMVERWALPSILVDQDFRIVHASEHAGRYLRVPGGEPSANVFKLLREELRVEVRAALHQAFEHAEPVRCNPIELQLEGRLRRVLVQIRPSRDEEGAGLSLVVFDEMDPEAPAASRSAAADTAGRPSELDRTQERLRTVIEQYETSQEEMKAANEELQSTNEELRSTMEELETSKEELQSMNEELQTVNQENRHKVEELSQLTSDLNNLMAATDIATLFLDRELRILRVTPRASELFNIRARDRGRPLTDLRRLVAYEQLEEDAREVFERLTPIQREVLGERGEWYLARVLPYRSAGDQIQGIVITLVEITTLKQTELALRDSEARFRALVTASAQIVWTTDAQGHFVEDSPTWRAFTGQSLEQMRSEGWLDAVHPQDRDHASDAWQDSVRQATALDTEFRLRFRDGAWRWMHVRAVPLLDDAARVRGWVGMNTDITARKTSEESLRLADRRKDEFLATLGHELRNPLAPMRTAIDVFKMRLPPDPELQQLQAMQERQLEHLTRLVDDLLDVARIKSGRLTLTLRSLDLRDVARTAIGDLQAAIDQGGYRLSFDQATEPLMVHGDEVRLDQVIHNLLDNAIKYTGSGGALRVITRREDDTAIVIVADDGIGIAPEIGAEIFDVFAQGPPGPDRAMSGLGLGLTLVRRLVDMHGGSVTVHSDGRDRGAEFTVRLPLAGSAASAREGVAQKTLPRPEQAAVQARPAGAAEADPERVPKRVLVVDDIADNATSLALALEIGGHEVRQAGNAERALEIAAELAPEAVVLDIGLPGMDGNGLARALRSREQTADALLIAVTGYGSDDDRERSREAGVDHFLSKPANAARLLELIDAGRPARDDDGVQSGT
ncbi:MAG: PAS domain S-box protein [Thiohalocapsa sp.]|nr:PAS domain S-box protein [Thiohalocapsa sp.]